MWLWWAKKCHHLKGGIWLSCECHAGADIIIKVVKWNRFSIKEVDAGIIKEGGVKECIMYGTGVLVVCSNGTVTIITIGIKGSVIARGNSSCIFLPSVGSADDVV